MGDRRVAEGALTALDALRQLPRPVLLAAGTVAMAGVLALESTVPGARLSVLYVAVAFLVTWTCGLRWGAAVAAVPVAVGVVEPVVGAATDPTLAVWNALSRGALLGAVVAATAMASAEVRRLRHEGERDPHLAVLNRRAFRAELTETVAWSPRTGRPIAVLFLDVDGLKDINDRDGHAAGDAAIATVAEAIVAGTRREDVVGRLGGDEFAVVMRGADARHTRDAAARIRGELSARPGAPTVSVGCSTHDGATACSAEELLAVADASMYQAKRSRTAIADDEELGIAGSPS